MATIEDVARVVGVAPSTVSGAFSGKKRMSVARREEILRVAGELRYEPNLMAQRLGAGKRHDVVSLLSPCDFSQQTRTARALVEGLQNQGFEVDCLSPPYYSEDAEERQIDLLNRVRRLLPRAIVFAFVLPPSAGLLRELRRYSEEGGVLVGYSLSPPPPFGDWVVFDRYQSSYEAIRFLLESGHRAIGFNAHGNDAPGDARQRAFRDALREFGLEPRDEWTFNRWNYEEGGLLLARDFLELKQRPTALHIINDYTASAFSNALFRAGVRVPDEVSVIGNEDSPAASAALVPLTTTSFPHEQIASATIQLLCERLASPQTAPPRHIAVRGQLVHRDSVAVLNRN